ncbi:MAG: DNA polymerase Y family protein [Limisphaerales bacterium]
MFAVILIPDFFLQAALRHEPELRDVPVALVNDDSPKSPVAQITSTAARFGVTPGLTSTQAKARCDRLIFRIRSPQQESSAQEILLECAYGSAAYIESTAPGICTLDLRSLPILKAENLGATFDLWGQQLLRRLEEFNLTARIGIASAPALALQAANGDQPVQYIRDPQTFWRSLKIENLCATPALADILRRWGIHTVAAFLALGKDQIAERLGPAGLELFDAAQADKIRPLNLTSPRQIYEEYFEFENQIETLEPLLFIARRFLDSLTRRVGLAYMVVQDLAITLQLESGQAHERTLKIPAPTRDVEILFRILHNYLETVRTSSPIIALSLRAQPAPSETQQFQLFETAVRDPNRFYETLGRLNALLGPDRVGTPVRKDSFRPDAFSLEPISAKSAIANTQALPIPNLRLGLVLRRFRPPIPTEVRLREGQPASIRNTRVNSSLTRSQGPFRASGEWWENLWTREEWDIQTNQGDLFRLIREHHQWFLDGAYD